MQLLTAALRRTIPKLYASDGHPNPTVQAKLFTPWTNWTWYVIEFDGEDTCFGLVEGHERELGYFSLSELESIMGPGGLRIERDLHFKPIDLTELKERLDGVHEQPRFPYTDRQR